MARHFRRERLRAQADARVRRGPRPCAQRAAGGRGADGRHRGALNLRRGSRQRGCIVRIGAGHAAGDHDPPRAGGRARECRRRRRRRAAGQPVEDPGPRAVRAGAPHARGRRRGGGGAGGRRRGRPSGWELRFLCPCAVGQRRDGAERLERGRAICAGEPRAHRPPGRRRRRLGHAGACRGGPRRHPPWRRRARPGRARPRSAAAAPGLLGIAGGRPGADRGGTGVSRDRRSSRCG